jgi:nitroreductase
MAESPVKSCIYARRSIRRFTTQRVERSLIEELLMAGCMAPTGSNIQSWRFLVLDDPRQMEAVRAVSPGVSGSPPCILVLCADERLALSKGGVLARDQLAMMDACMAAQNIMLLATEKGLGSCVIKSFQAVLVQRLLGLPEDIKPHLLITLGYPAEPPRSAPKRRPLSEILRYNKWEE